MNIFNVIYFPLLIYMFHDFRKAFLLYVLLKIFLNQNINLINLPGVPLLELELFMNICFCFYFLLFKRKIFYNEEKFPLKVAYILCFVSIIISTIFSTVGFTSAVTRALKDILNNYVFVYIFWRVVREKKDIIFLLKGFSYVFIVLGFYGFYEKFTGMNPLVEYEISLNPAYRVIEWKYSDVGRLGMGRIRSAILHAIGFGVYLGIIISFYLFIQRKFKNLWEMHSYLKVLLSFLCITCLFFTNSRSPIIYLLISIFPIFDFKDKRTYQTFFIAILGLMLAWNFIEPYSDNLISLYNMSVAEEVGGSSMGMRKIQFAATFDIFSRSPFIGLGIKVMDKLYGRASGLLGAESVWISLLIERGILGVISYISLIISIAKIGKNEIKYFIWSSTIAWLTLSTVTSTPGISISFFLSIICILNRIQILFGKKMLCKI